MPHKGAHGRAGGEGGGETPAPVCRDRIASGTGTGYCPTLSRGVLTIGLV